MCKLRFFGEGQEFKNQDFVSAKNLKNTFFGRKIWLSEKMCKLVFGGQKI